jgi:protein-tyrosine phosphatase
MPSGAAAGGRSPSTGTDRDRCGRLDRVNVLDLTPHEARFVRLEATLNMRDLGGLPLAGGGATRSGRLLRSDVPLRLPPADLATLGRLGLRTVVDLRQAHELEREPSALTGRSDVTVHHVELWTLVNDGGEQPDDPWSITGFYLALLEHAGAAFAASARILADAEGAALFHCTAGKDRTGMLAMLLLDLAGVERDALVADFALTDARIEPIRTRLLDDAERRGIARADFVRLLGATPDLIEPALEHLDRRHGGAAAYLRRHGVSDPTLERLHAKLTA